jgi:molybdopterin synthase sulfur carrier subunit
VITVKIRSIFYLKEILGSKEIEITLREDSTVSDVIQFLIEKYGKKIEEVIKNPDGSFNLLLTIFVNGRQIDLIKGLETKLKNGDIVSFIPIPPRAGG